MDTRTAVEGSVLQVQTEDPGMAIADILEQVGPLRSAIEGIEIIRPSLETAYLTLTGHRFTNEEDVNVVAA